MSQIRIPYHDRSDPLPAVADATRALPEGDDRAVARQIVLRGMTSGVATAGDLLDELDAMSPAERRALLDQVRVGAGLPSTAEVDAQRARRVRAPMICDDARDEVGRALQVCAATGCRAFPIDPVTSAHAPHVARRWWCDEHVAGHEDDMEAWTMRIGYGPSGAIVFLDELERDAEIAEREAERRAAWLEERRAQRIKEWPALQEADAAQAQALMGDNFKAPKGAQP
jgi:hypothetical protein